MRIRSDLKFGTLTDNPLLIGSTSINSGQFATLPVVTGGDELWITLEPEGSNREYVKVTAHSASGTLCVGVRGQLGTTAAAHPLLSRWVQGIVTTDVTVPCTSSTRPTLGLWAGMKIYETDKFRELTYNGSAWIITGGKVPYVELNKGTGQNIPDATSTAAEWAEAEDTDGFHATNATTTIPTIPGLYRYTAGIAMASAVVKGHLRGVFSGAEVVRGPDVTDIGAGLSVGLGQVSFDKRYNGTTDAASVNIYHSSGATVATEPTLCYATMVYLGA